MGKWSWAFHEKIQDTAPLSRRFCSTKLLVYENHNLQPRALQQDGAGGKGLDTPEIESQHKRAEGLILKSVILQSLWKISAFPIEVGGRASEFLWWCQLQCDSGGMTGKLTFGKGTQVSIISGESSQMAPLATPWASATNPCLWDLFFLCSFFFIT